MISAHSDVHSSTQIKCTTVFDTIKMLKLSNLYFQVLFCVLNNPSLA